MLYYILEELSKAGKKNERWGGYIETILNRMIKGGLTEAYDLCVKSIPDKLSEIGACLACLMFLRGPVAGKA